MSFKRKFISAITMGLATAACATFVAAQDAPKPDDSTQQTRQERMERRGGKFGGKGMRGGKHHGGEERHLMRALGQLNLTDAQKEQTKTVFESFKKSTEPQREEMRGLMMKKRDGIITADEEARFKEIRTQMKTAGEQMHNQILAILTAEQRTQLDKMKEEMKQKMTERRNRRNEQNELPAPQSN